MKADSIWNYVDSPSMDGLVRATGYFLTYMIGMFLGAKFLPSVEGRSPKKTYRLTGLSKFLTLTVLIGIGYYTNQISLLFIVKNYASLFIVINLFAIAFSLYLFYRPVAVQTAPNANSLLDFWSGREKDPLLSNVDLKVFFYQPSLLGLALINVSLAEAQWTRYGQLTGGMICYQAFWYLYLLSHYLREDFMLWSFDIIEDHFGFMLVWGDLVYLPFLYSVAGWYIADNVDKPLSSIWLTSICLLHVVSHYVFRESNWQKYRVRRDGPNIEIWGKKVVLLEQRLLLTGFWGVGRHLNYTGEILLYLSIALCSGTSSLVPYILPMSLTVLLVQRAHRDDQRCRKKYGDKTWNKYCSIAKFRMIPFIY